MADWRVDGHCAGRGAGCDVNDICSIANTQWQSFGALNGIVVL